MAIVIVNEAMTKALGMQYEFPPYVNDLFSHSLQFCASCPPFAYHCANSTRCIAKEKQCNGRKDCDQGDDEVGCGGQCNLC